MSSGSGFTVRAAKAAEAAAVRDLLRASELPVDGVPDDLADFLVATRDDAGTIVGTIGLERYGGVALLRSAAVRATERGAGIGEALVDRIMTHARSSGVHTLVLLTTTAERWFPRFGFERIDRNAAPPALRASAEFRGACPDSAITMALNLTGSATKRQ